MTKEWIKQLKENILNLESNLNLIQIYYKKYEKKISDIFVSEDDYKFYKITLTPIQIDIAAHNLFEPFPLVIFMSSTIDKKLFSKDLGLEDKSTEYLSYDSPIDPSRRKIYEYYTGLKVWKDSKDGEKRFDPSMKLIINRIEELMERHPDERGLILINSKLETEKIINDIDPELKKRLTYRDYEGEVLAKTASERKAIEKFNEELLQEHKDKANSVLISPSMWEGVDLKNDLGRFCIIAKSPFSPGTTKFALAKTQLRNEETEWKDTKDFFKLIQGFGRCTRGVKDYSTTYLIEKGCQDMLNSIKEYQNNHKDSKIKWFTDAIKPFSF
jgi:Rad3-related DNA helicase